MARLAGKKHPAPAKYAPYAYAVRSLRRKKRGLLPLCYAYGCEVRQKAAALFFEKSKSQSKKERGETAAAPNLKKEKKKEQTKRKKTPRNTPKKERPHERKPTNHHARPTRKRKMLFVHKTWLDMRTNNKNTGTTWLN
jgi:hypothetical protein